MSHPEDIKAVQIELIAFAEKHRVILKEGDAMLSIYDALDELSRNFAKAEIALAEDGFTEDYEENH